MLHYFNPGHETAVLNRSPYYTPAANQIKMQHDLAFLPAWYASPEDFVWVEEYLPEDFSLKIKRWTNTIGHPITKEELVAGKFFLQDHEISLWGISPQAIHYWQQQNRVSGLNLRIPEWHTEYMYLCSRQAAKQCLQHLVENNPEIQADIIPHFYNQPEDIEQAVNQSSFRLLAKAPYSSSGRGLLWLPESGLTRTEQQILHGMLRKQQSVSIEKVLDKKLDFAMEFFSDGKSSITYKGLSLFQTSNKGAYSGNWIASQEKIQTKILSFTDKELFDKIKETLLSFLQKNYAPLYKGCIGVDMMIYEENGQYYIHPCVEINMRYNMGWLAIHLHEKIFSGNIEGYFHIDFNAQESAIYQQHLLMEKSYPLVINNNRIQSGYLPLCPVMEKSKYTAYLLVNKE